MKKYLAILILVVCVGCSPLIKNPITPENLSTIESSYGLALTAAVNYRQLRMCKKLENPTPLNFCAKRDIIIRLQNADRKVQSALTQLRTFIVQYPDLDATSFLVLAKIAISEFQSIQIENGIK